MSTIVEKKTLVCSDFENNANKFWKITRFNDNTVKTEWGRIGNSHDEQTKSFSSTKEAEKFFNSKVRDKLRAKEGRRDAYTEIEVLDDQKINSSPIKDLAELAANEIETASPDVKEFVKWLAKINIHNIVQNTTIQYNINEGTFSTPLGVIGTNTLNEAKTLLDRVSNFTDVNDKECIKIINQYIRRIPQDMGGSHVKIQARNVFGTPELLQRQLDIIEGLETAITQAKSTQRDEATERVFNTKLDICNNLNTVGEIKERFARHGNGSHISNVYEVNIETINDRFLTVGLPIGNIDRLWHGTGPANILSIFKFGLCIPKTYTNGRRFLDGIYFSDRSSMSLSYAPSTRKDNSNYKYLFLSDVAVGKYYEPEYLFKGLPSGYNSCWAEKKQNTSQIIVYNPGQATIKYLIEIEN